MSEKDIRDVAARAKNVQLVVVSGITLTGPADPYLPLKALAAYSGCSARWLRDRLADPRHPLPHYRPYGKGWSAGASLTRGSSATAASVIQTWPASSTTSYQGFDDPPP